MLVLVLGFAVKQSAGSWKAAVIVGKMLIDSFTSRSVERTSVTAAEELVRGLTFDRYNEKIYCQILTRIKETDFETVVNRISSRYQIPDEIQGAIMDGHRGTQRDYSSKPLKHSIVELILVFKR